MLAFNHILAGSIVGAIAPAPLVPFIATASHFVMDILPHAYGEEPPYSRFLKIQIGADAVISIAAVALIFILFPEQWLIVGIGAFFGLLPDFLWLFWKRGPKWLDKFLDWAHWIQWAEWRHGWILDGMYASAFVYFLIQISDVI